PQHSSNKGMFVLMGVLIAALVGLGAWLVADKLGGQDSQNSADATAANAPVNTTTTLTATETATAAQTATATWSAGPPPPDNQPCPGYAGLGTGYPQWTGCEFAANVRNSYIAGGPMGEVRSINGWAPQQQKNYEMHCAPYLGVIACRGGNQAVVYIY
ncbi:MAG: hypothetical protein WAW85_16025, partial [Gordonia sp. (in: high G+C Gram-positive bacteria)]